MPRGKTGRTVTTATAKNLGKARKDAEITSIHESNNFHPNLTTTTKPRRSPRKLNSSETVAKQHPPSKGNERPKIGNHSTNNKVPNLNTTTTLALTTDPTATSKAAAKSSPNPGDKAKAVVQFNSGTSGGPKSADPVPPASTRHLRPGRGPRISARSKQCAGRNPERSASRHRPKRQRGKADNPRVDSAVGRGPHNKVSSKPVTKLIPAPTDSAAPLHAEDPQVESIREDLCASGSRQLLTGEALEELARALESDQIKRSRSTQKIGAAYSGEDSEDGFSQGTVIDSREHFNRKWGYVPPLDEETTRIIQAIIKDPTCVETMVGIGPDEPMFVFGLKGRNVSLKPSAYLDPREEDIKSISLEGYLQETQDQETSHEELWKSDKAKCTPDSSEALYQRTLMINLISRHSLIYQFDSSKQQIFDFSVEEPWGCLPMPSRVLWDIPKGRESEAKFLTQPKPDLAVCFIREAVISDSMWKTLPEPTKGLACFENSLKNDSRIFHFLAIEAKKAMVDTESPQALHQCLNNASQALHNMFEFFRDAGPKHEQLFYDKVRFFSIVANRRGLIVRIHRAIRFPDDASPWELVMPDRPEYRLKFEFRELHRINDRDDFSRKKVLEAIKKILKHATDDLLAKIKAAASDLVQNLQKDLGMHRARRKEDFYSYGQPNPRSSKSSRRTSVVPSTTGDGVQQKFQSAKLDSNCASLDQSVASGQTTPRQPHQPFASFRLASKAQKRRVDEIESDRRDMRAPDPPVRKRRKLSCSKSELSLPSPATARVTVGSRRGRRAKGF